MLIPIELYKNAYYLLLSTTVLLSILPLFNYTKIENFPKINLYTGTFLILLTVLLFIGFRDPFGSSMYFGDTKKYATTFIDIDNATYGEKKDIGFYTLMLICKSFMGISSFFLVCATIYVIPVFYTFKRWFKEYAFFALLMFVTSMSFWGFGINGIRNGIATSIFIFALGFYNKKVIAISIMLLSITFHSSLILPFVAFLLTLKITDTKLLIKIWAVAVILSFFVGSQIEALLGDYLISALGEDEKRIETYFSNELDGQVLQKSFRVDFVIYSAIAIFLGYLYKIKFKFEDKFYTTILNTYIISNTVWVLLIYLVFTNRTAYLSWFLMPIVLIYPVLKNKNLVQNQSKWIYLMILGSLIFTLLMEFK